jgi:hypothetical protein
MPDVKVLAPHLFLGIMTCPCCEQPAKVRTNKARMAYCFCSYCGYNARATSAPASQYLVRKITKFEAGMERHTQSVYPDAPAPALRSPPKVSEKTSAAKPAPAPALAPKRRAELPYEDQ